MRISDWSSDVCSSDLDLQICPEIVVESRRIVDARVLVRIRRREGREVTGGAGSATGDSAAFGPDILVGVLRFQCADRLLADVTHRIAKIDRTQNIVDAGIRIPAWIATFA